MLLYEHPLSSYAQKVKIALREKSVAFEAELPESFGTGRTDGPFVAANPRAEVPVLFGGETFGWADAAVAPMVNRSVHYGMGPSPGSSLARWHQRVCERPSVATTFAEFDAAAARMAAAADYYTTGGRRREYRDHRLEW